MSTIPKEKESVVVSGHMAELINKMAEKFFSDPKKIEDFKKWHLEQYGCLP